MTWDYIGTDAATGNVPTRLTEAIERHLAASRALQRCLDFTPAARELAQAVRKRETRAQKILARLRQGPANSQEMMAVGGLRFGARILELRQAGHKITTEEHAEYAIYRLEEGA